MTNWNDTAYIGVCSVDSEEGYEGSTKSETRRSFVTYRSHGRMGPRGEFISYVPRPISTNISQRYNSNPTE